MQKKIRSALISVFYKDGLEPIVRELSGSGAVIYSTGGTQKFIESLGIDCVPVEEITSYPSILGGRVKTLHPKVFGAILGRRDVDQDLEEMKQYEIPEFDLVIVDLYPFEETVSSTDEEKLIIEKIDIGGPSMIRAAAKNFRDLLVVASRDQYAGILELLRMQKCETTIDQRKYYAAKAFEIVANYDVAIAKYFNTGSEEYFLESIPSPKIMRYGENPHQQAIFYGNNGKLFNQVHGKELSYNNLVDSEAAMQLIREFSGQEYVFAIIKHTNVCGVSKRTTVSEAWKDALAGDPESAFGGVLVTNGVIDKKTAEEISGIFFEVLISPGFDADALEVLMAKKNRILLQQVNQIPYARSYRSMLNGILTQVQDKGNVEKWEEVGGRKTTDEERENLEFANLVCKHLKSNAIALVRNKQLIGKGCGQTSRVDALRQAIEKAKQFNFNLDGAVMASDAFFPFSDCVQMGHEAGIKAYIQPGGSIRDKDSVDYCTQHGLAMVMTGMRHFRH
jgi:phosphoribosylaminoimidazolecarboxamide formyltransferase / IMP cyclohydrolase